jgi:UDP-2-acetamido-2-deoxy-ribo-hexuluronate aminotransferase
LGCYGDGGAVFTSDSVLAEKIRVILNHGQIKRYHHSTVGMNGRMDSLQAAILSVKLRHFEDELAGRRKVAAKYTDLLKDVIDTPQIEEHNTSSWAQYTVQHSDREKVREALKNQGIPTAVHYPIPLHKQEAFAYLENGDSFSTPVTERISEGVFSLPMHPFLKDEEIEKVASVIRGIK